MSYTFGDGWPNHWLGTTVEQYSTAHDQIKTKVTHIDLIA